MDRVLKFWRLLVGILGGFLPVTRRQLTAAVELGAVSGSLDAALEEATEVARASVELVASTTAAELLTGANFARLVASKLVGSREFSDRIADGLDDSTELEHAVADAAESACKAECRDWFRRSEGRETLRECLSEAWDDCDAMASEVMEAVAEKLADKIIGRLSW